VPRIKDASVEAVKAAADMVQVVQTRTQLRKAGARWTGRCPFHEEKTPSFSVNAADKLYYCFGCGKGGDLISFVRDTEVLDFAEAIEWLAERFSVQLEYDESSPQADADRRRRDRLFALLEQATAFFERYLWDSAAGEPVREYLATRGVTEETAKVFRLGLSPLGSTLSRKAREKSFTAAELSDAGLVTGRGDRFTGRLMFPLTDARGRVVGFSARKLRDDDPLAKYVNSPETELFHKSAILYGLHLARPAVAKQDRAVVVEGQMDVIALHQAGLETVVAAMGTALTERQVKELARVTRRLYLCFDADAAGQSATLRGMAIARKEGFDVHVVALPKGSKDPADDPTGFQARLGQAASYPLHGIRVICERPGSAQEKFVAAREFLESIEESPDRDEALRFLADRLDLPKETQAGLAPRRGGRAMAAVSPALLAAGGRLERDALAGCVAHPKLLPALAKLGPEHFDDELYRRLRAHLLGEGAADGELVALLAELDARASDASIDEQTAEQQLLRLRERQLKRELSKADDERLPDLVAALDKVRSAFRQLA
jgi:DNA primase